MTLISTVSTIKSKKALISLGTVFVNTIFLIKRKNCKYINKKDY